MSQTDLLRRLVPGWTPRDLPGQLPLEGRLVRLERLSAERHGPALYAANAGDERMWDYMFSGPFATLEEYLASLRLVEGKDDPAAFAILDKTGAPRGVASYMRIDRIHGVCEVGSIALSPGLQRRPEATEAMFLMADHVFSLGYRRYEWKCNAANLASRRAALRYGFSYEGTFRNHMVVKGQSRDTAWFAMTAEDWPNIRQAHLDWLSPDNFDASGQQRIALSDLTRPLLVSLDPIALS